MKTELNSEKKEKKREAVKKVIASMTVGKDVSALFPDVVNCMQTDNVELKKLVYLYLMNYAKSQPELAIMAVNTFVKDCEDPNPLIRALAVRTMGCIRVDKITEYLCEPLRKCMKDEDPYVRKTAAICVAKLHDINPNLVEDQGWWAEAVLISWVFKNRVEYPKFKNSSELSRKEQTFLTASRTVHNQFLPRIDTHTGWPRKTRFEIYTNIQTQQT